MHAHTQHTTHTPHTHIKKLIFNNNLSKIFKYRKYFYIKFEKHDKF